MLKDCPWLEFRQSEPTRPSSAAALDSGTQSPAYHITLDTLDTETVVTVLWEHVPLPKNLPLEHFAANILIPG